MPRIDVPMGRRSVLTGLSAAGLSLTGAAGGALAFAGPAAADPAPENTPFEPKSVLSVNVKDHGAKGDGKTDDTAAIQAAINSLIPPSPQPLEQRGGGTVFFPAGTYAISAPLVVANGTQWYNRNGFWLEGEGAGSRILRLDPKATHSLVTFVGPAGKSDAADFTGGFLQNVGMRKLVIGSSDPSVGPASGTGDPAVTMSKTVQWVIEDCVIEQPGGTCLDLTDAYIGRINHNVIRLGDAGLAFHGTANAVQITSNRFQNCQGSAIEFADPNPSPAGATANGVTIYIAGNDIEGNGEYAILLGDFTVFEAVTIIGNHMEQNWNPSYGKGDGPFVFKTPGGGAFCRGVSVISNRFLNFTRAQGGVVFSKGTNISILSNSFVARGGGPTARNNGYTLLPKATNWIAGPTDTGSLESDGELRVHDPAAGVVLTSPDGTAHRILVGNDGTLTTVAA